MSSKHSVKVEAGIHRDANFPRQSFKNQFVSLPTQPSPVQHHIYNEHHLLWIFQSVMLWLAYKSKTVLRLCILMTSLCFSHLPIMYYSTSDNLSFSALSHNLFCDTPRFSRPLPLHCPSFIHMCLPSSLALLLWQRCRGPFLLPSCTELLTDRTKGLSLHQSCRVNARVSACERSKPAPAVLISV